MTEFLKAIKADLIDSRRGPVLGLLVAALLAAVAYAALGGGSSSSPPAITPLPAVSGLGGIAVSPAPANANQAVAETTSGASKQRGGSSRDPFTPLPGATTTTTATTPATSTGSSPSSSTSASTGGATAGGQSGSSGSSSHGSSGGSGASPKGSSSPKTPQAVYRVSVLFGVSAPVTPPATAQLTPYDELKRAQPLPDSKQPLVVFRGVVAGGKSVSFTIVGEAILRGQGACLPNPSHCQWIDLKAGQTEELEYLPLGGSAVTYQLQVVEIASGKASSAAHSASAGLSRRGVALLRSLGLMAMPGMRYSQAKGVLVFAPRKAFSARAHTAVHSPLAGP